MQIIAFIPILINTGNTSPQRFQFCYTLQFREIGKCAQFNHVLNVTPRMLFGNLKISLFIRQGQLLPDVSNAKWLLGNLNMREFRSTHIFILLL